MTLRARRPSAQPAVKAARRLCAGALIALTAAFPATAQMTLQTAALLSTEQDPNITALRQEVASRTVDIEAARDGYYPSFSLSGDSSTTDSDGPGITLTVSQVLFDWGKIRSDIKAASQVRVQSISDLKMAVEDMTLEVAEFFLDVEIMGRKIARTRTYVDFAHRIAQQASDRASAGVSDNGEVARARLEIARADDQMSQLVSNRQIAMSQLAYLIGQDPMAIVPPAGTEVRQTLWYRHQDPECSAAVPGLYRRTRTRSRGRSGRRKGQSCASANDRIAGLKAASIWMADAARLRSACPPEWTSTPGALAGAPSNPPF